MVKKRIDAQIEKKIRLFAKKVSQTGVKIHSVIVFGSYAKGTAKAYSDIDVCITSSNFGKDELSEAAKLRLIANEIDWRIEPHLLTQKDLKTRSNPFVYQIMSTGINISR